MLISIAMPSSGWIGPWNAWTSDCRLAGLILELIDRMAGMMPEQMIRPASRFAFGVHVRSPEEKCLDDKMLQLEFALLIRLWIH